jgi:hypothetical protein
MDWYRGGVDVSKKGVYLSEEFGYNAAIKKPVKKVEATKKTVKKTDAKKK